MSNLSKNIFKDPKTLAVYILPLTAALIVCRSFPVLSFFYYAVPFLLFLTLSLTLTHIHSLPRQLKILLVLISAFGIWSAVTAFWSPYPFVTLKRAGYFLLISIPTVMLGYFWSREEKNDLFGYLLPANIIVVIVSLYSLITGLPDNAWTGGHGLGFMGYASHQNILAAAFIFTIPSVFSLLTANYSRLTSSVSRLPFSVSLLTSSVSRLPFSVSRLTTPYSLLAINVSLLILTYSRASMLALAGGVLVYLILIKSYKILAVLFASAVILIILYSTILPSHSELVEEQSTIQRISHSISALLRKDGGELFSRRTILWEPSLEAAELGGLFGLGYGISAPSIKISELTGSYYDDGRYVREKGNSVLALVEEVGVVGLMIFLSIIGYVLSLLFSSVKRERQKGRDVHSPILRNESFGHPCHSELVEELSTTCPPLADSPIHSFSEMSPSDNHSALRNSHSDTHLSASGGFTLKAALLLSALAALFVHAQFEGWWSGVGSVHLPLFFILLGLTARCMKSL